MDEILDKDKKNKSKDYIPSKDISNLAENLSNQNVESKRFKNWLVNENKKLYGKQKLVPPLFEHKDNDEIDQTPETYYKFESSDINFVF